MKNSNNKKTINLVFGVMLFSTLLFSTTFLPTVLQVQASDGSSWLEGWDYRKSHTITGSVAANVTDYIFGFKVYKGSGTDGTEIYGSTTFGKVYCDDKCRDDFLDIRFTDSDGNTTLDINLMNIVVGNYTYAWVKTSLDDYPANKTIYMYYGNTNATSVSIAEEYFFEEAGHGRTQQGNGTSIGDGFDRVPWSNQAVIYNNSKSVYWYCNVADSFIGRLTVLYGYGSNMTKQAETPTFTAGPGFTRVGDIFNNTGYELNMTAGCVMGHFKTNGTNAPSIALESTSKYHPGGYLPVGSNGDFSNEYTFNFWTAVVGYRLVVYPEPSHTSWSEEETPVSWIDGWNYRKSHTIIPGDGAGVNYQVKLNVHYGNGTDMGTDVYLDDKCQPDFGDIRFTDDDGETLLDYWMQSKSNSDKAIFWVEVADDLSSSNATIYLYYGNSEVNSTSNGVNTFIFFDDFEDNLDDWNSTGITTISSDFAYEGGSNCFKGGIGQSLIKRNSLGYANVSVHTFYFDQKSEGLETQGLIPCGTSEIATIQVHENVSSTHYVYRVGSTYYVSDIPRTNSTHEFCIRVSNNTREYVIDGSVQNTTGTQNSINSIALGSWWTANSAESYFDDCFVRKYVTSEPMHTDWGTEETGW